MVAARMPLTRRVSAGSTIWRHGGGCGRAGFCIRAFAREGIWRRSQALQMMQMMNPCIRELVVSARMWPSCVNWRFRVPEGEAIEFADLNLGRQRYVAGSNFDFGDFLVWRRDDVPAYQLAVVVDDRAMRITEVVRGADLLKSTARQLLLLRALGYAAPEYFHCELVRDTAGVRLAKRHDALSIRHLRESGMTAESLLELAFSAESRPGLQ